MTDKIIDRIISGPDFEGTSHLYSFFTAELLEGGGKRDYGLWSTDSMVSGFEGKLILAEKVVKILKSEIRDSKSNPKKAWIHNKLQNACPDYIDFSKAKPYKYKKLETRKDFDAIIARELKTRNLKDTRQFRDLLETLLDGWKGSFKRWHGEKIDTDFLNRVDEFIKYLKGKTENNGNITLESLFIEKYGNNDGYLRIIGELVNLDFCYKDTHYWIKPEGYKRIIASLIKYIGMNYLDRISNKNVILIAKNTFNIDIRIDTVKGSDSKKPSEIKGDF